MRCFIPKETVPGETRAAVTPEAAARLVKLGLQLEVEAGAGTTIGVSDAAFAQVGASLSGDRHASLGAADLVLRLSKPSLEDVGVLKPGAIHISFLDPFNARDVLSALAARGVSALSMEMIPRTTIAQKMDALSSQANLGGYVAVMLAAQYAPRIFPMMMTPAGTIPPARVFVIGAGVAGLQAIATARRLGARVEAFDTRPVVEEQVRSLGARFVKIDLGETGQTSDGYAKALTEEQIARQQAAMAQVCAQCDVVITTAQVFGRRAPILLTVDMVRGMRPGSVVVDMAVESGGNVACSRLNEVVEVNGVRVVGMANLPGRVPVTASQMYAGNVVSLVEHFWDKSAGAMVLKTDDDIIKGCLATHGGQIVNGKLQEG